MITFQEILRKLSYFWEKQGCIIHQGYDLETGAGTFNPATFLRCLGPEPYKAAYIEPSRRPTDGRYGTNPNRLQHYFQYQVILKPSPPNIQDLYLQSLEEIGFNLNEHDIRFVHDDWEAPTLGAWGLGWEVWMDGMEVTQFTYFQCVGGVNLKPITGEITYGIERLAMYLQKVDSIFDLQWNEDLSYGDIYQRNEVEWSFYNFEKASTEMWLRHFDDYENEARRLIKLNLPIPAYDFVMKTSHAFNILDARGVISVTERTGYIGKIRDLARAIAESYIKSREEQNFPLLDRLGHYLKEIPDEGQKAEIHLTEELLHFEPGKTEDFLLEIGSEELPATFVPIGCQNLEKGIKNLLEKEGISFKSIRSYGTPRRIAVYVQDLALGKNPQIQEKKGPALEQAFDVDGSLKPAGEGFFRSIGKRPLSISDIREQKDRALTIRQIKGIEYLFATIEIPGSSTAALLFEHLPNIILNLDFPKKMRWGNSDIAYARPLRWIVSLFGKHVVPFNIGQIYAGRESQGHRQLRPFSFSLVKAQDYLAILKEHRVLVDMTERRKQIVAQLHALEKTLGGTIICQERVIPQVLNLVEWPQATFSEFDRSFLKIPKEVLISEMVEHQKYFPVAQADGTLMNLFIITCDTNPTDQIREGNQKVLSARLSDGVFLYEQGLKIPLEDFNEKLKNVTFQKELGSVFDKVKRIVDHVGVIQSFLGIGDPVKAKRAALLCKADLASEMVYEFPDLQGIIGRYYALASGEDAEIASAIDEHWMPRGENAPLPETITGILVCLADKIDNLLGCFCVNLKPTSSSDPYALRRQTLGIIKMLIRGEYRLPLRKTLDKCLDNFPLSLIKDREKLIDEVSLFITNRIRNVFLDYGFDKDEIEACISQGVDDIYDAFCKVKSLHQFRLVSPQFPLLYEVYKRAKGQLADKPSFLFKNELLSEKAEIQLDQMLTHTKPLFDSALQKRDYDRAYDLVAQIQPYLNNLFEDVKILADEASIRENRLALLQRIFALFDQLLDFSKISENK